MKLLQNYIFSCPYIIQSLLFVCVLRGNKFVFFPIFEFCTVLTRLILRIIISCIISGAVIINFLIEALCAFQWHIL